MTSEMGTNSRGPYNTEVNRLAKLLMDTWYKVDPKSSVTIHPASYVANFADMAKTIIADQNTRAVPDVTELVRYEFSEGVGEYIERADGDYVLYTEAAAIIAAKDAGIEVWKGHYATSNKQRNKADGENERLRHVENDLRDLKASILQSKTLADFNTVRKTVIAISALNPSEQRK